MNFFRSSSLLSAGCVNRDAAGLSQPAARPRFMPVTRAAGCITLLLGGCMIPMERQNTLDESLRQALSAEIALQLSQHTFVGPPAPVTVEVPTDDGIVRMSVPPTSTTERESGANAGEQSSSLATSKWEWKEKVPWGIAILCAGFGFLVLAVAIWLFVSKTRLGKVADTTAAGLVNASRETIGRMVNRVRAAAGRVTDPSTITEMKALEADLAADAVDWEKD